ncbi:MAG: DUF3703 domain-containing protein [Rhodospirillaceae bacterium]
MALVKSEKRLSAFHAEIKIAGDRYVQGDLDGAFLSLERAHVLGQPWMGPHSRTHWMMLKVGLRRRDAREVMGQLIRLTGGGVLSIFGRLPEGNTGGANVPAEKPMPVPADLQALCEP